MNNLPTGWAWTELAQVCTSITDGDHQAPPQVPLGIPFLVIGNIRTQRLDFTDCRHVPPEYFESLNPVRRPQKGDVLYSLVGSYGISVLVTDDSPFCVQRHIGILRPSPEISSAFLALALSSRAVFDQATQYATGTAQLTVPLSGLRRIRVPLPPRQEQERIVAVIEEQFSRLDAGAAALQRTQARLEAFSRSVVANALGGACTENAPFAVGAAEIIGAKRAARTTGWRKKPAVLPVGKPLPRGWAWTTLDEIAADRPNALKAGPFGSALKKEFYVDRGYKVYGQEQVIRGDASYGNYYISEEKYLSLASCAVRPRDLLISLVGTIGRTLILDENFEPGIINPRLIKVSLDEDVISPEYLAIVLQSSAVRAQLKFESHGETMDVINLGMLRRLPIPCPPPEHQAVIVERLAVHSDLIEHFKTALESARRHATALRYSILAAAFSGRLIPQEPSDEPASLLLERLAVQRASSNSKIPARTRKSRVPREEITR